MRGIRAIAFSLLGGFFGLLGWLLSVAVHHRALGWVLTGMAVGALSRGRRASGAVLGGVAVLVGFLIGGLIHYPMLAWPLLGVTLGSMGGKGVKGSALGFLAGFLGANILPLFVCFLLPLLGLPTTFDWDVEAGALILASGAIAGTFAWMGGER